MLSAETEVVRNGIVAATHASRCNVICWTDNSDTTVIDFISFIRKHILYKIMLKIITKKYV